MLHWMKYALKMRENPKEEWGGESMSMTTMETSSPRILMLNEDDERNSVEGSLTYAHSSQLSLM